MGRELYERDPIFRRQVDVCCELLLPELGLDLRQLLYPSEPTVADAERLTQTALAQPALFVVEYALAQTWLARGVQASVMVGHSLGEYVAAVLAGIFTLKDALHLLAVRGRLMQSLPAGRMLAVAMAEEGLAALLDSGLALAAVNGPRSCVVSGPVEAVAALRDRLAAQGVACRELKTSHAFHSSMMDPILAEFEREVRGVPRMAPRISLVSSLHGRPIAAEQWLDPAYWSGQLRRAVRFADALGSLLSQENLVLLEVGPGQTLSSLVRQHPARRADQVAIHSCSRREDESDATAWLHATGELWQAGVEIEWKAAHAGRPPRRVVLPGYPFERKRHWIEPQRAEAAPEIQRVSAPRPAPISSRVYAESASGASGLEALIEEQLCIMTRQIELLREPALAGTDERWKS